MQIERVGSDRINEPRGRYHLFAKPSDGGKVFRVHGNGYENEQLAHIAAEQYKAKYNNTPLAVDYVDVSFVSKSQRRIDPRFPTRESDRTPRSPFPGQRVSRPPVPPMQPVPTDKATR